MKPRTAFNPLTVLFLTLSLALLSGPASATIEWPQQIDAPEATIIIYQPQPEKLDGNRLSGRAAIALEVPGQDEPIFGAMWFSARLETDRDTDIATVLDFKVEKVRWPDSKDADEQRFTAIVEGTLPQNGFEISMERLAASLATAEIEEQSLAELKNDPPKILFSEELSVLLLFDGKPRFSPIENSPYERALNTPFAVVKEAKGNNHYLTSGSFWYQSRDALGPWSVTSNPPADLVQNMPKPDSEDPAPATPPKIVVATEPTELVSTSGKPKWTSLTGGELLYVENTETPWVRELATNNMYVLLSGRWYRSRSQQGPWTFVRPDELPASFQAIPPASDIGGLRTSVAGTPEAEEAVLDAAIPQTAAIKRSEAKLTVEYDGQPRFEKIKGTQVSYAVNTGAQVLEIDGRYYAVDNGVWFTSAAAAGPWVVADDVPEEQIAQIPPSSPVYNTTHVHVYNSTPEVVYVGYTPGYLWSFPYYGVPVYGTGWYYPPYYGRWYYPRPATWGFHVGYNPWTGWNFGVSWSNGFFRFGMSWGGGYGGYYRPWGCCGGWYGGGYHRPIVINTGNINIGNSINIGNQARIGDRMARNPEISNRMRDQNQNLYQRPESRDRVADRGPVTRDLPKARPAAGRDNNVFADRSGEVVRRDGDRWEQREQGQWKPVPEQRPAAKPEQRPAARPEQKPAARPEQRPAPLPSTKPSSRPAPQPSTRPSSRPSSRPAIDTRDLNRSHSARQTGASREMARPAPSGRQQPRRRN